MSLKLTRTTRNLSTQNVIEPNLIAEVDGIPLLFGVRDVTVLPSFDEVPPLLFDDGIFFDTPRAAGNSRAYIDFKGATKNKQQILPDKGGAGSVASMQLRLINKDGELTELFSSGVNIDDIFGAEVKLFIGFQGGSHPEDSNELFRGVCTEITTDHGGIVIKISHPDQLKRQPLFDLITDRLTIPLDSVSTTINIGDTTPFTIPIDETNIESYVLIDEEIIKLSTNITATTFDDVLRGQLGSSLSDHDVNADVQSFYRLKGKPIDLSLRVMISGADDETQDILSFKKYGDIDINNAVFFEDNNIADELGIAIGDTITITGTALNDGVRTIIGFNTFEGGSYLLTDGAEFIYENMIGLATISSQFNTLPIGLSISPSKIDMDGTIKVKEEIDAGLPDIDIYIEDQIKNVKEWLEQEIYKPCAIYSVNRKGRISIKFTRPAIADEEIKIISPDNIEKKSITNIKLRRSFGKNFYNQVTYSFERNPIKDKYEANTFIVSADSLNRIKLGTKQLLHEANAFRDNGATRQAVARIGSRVLSRYQFGARYIDNVQVLWSTGYSIEVGDTVLVKDLKIADLEKNKQTFGNILMEVVNKELDIKNGVVKISLLDSNFGVDNRYATISPASKISSLKTSKSVKIIRSFGVNDIVERTKYESLIGGKFNIRSQDFSQSQTVTLADFNPSDESELTFEETITVPVDNTYIVEFASYDSLDDVQKLLHVSLAPNELVVSGSSEAVFDSSVTSLFVGAVIQVTRENFTAWSNEATILDITGNTVTVDKNLGFIPANGDIVGVIGFSSDLGGAYRLV